MKKKRITIYHEDYWLRKGYTQEESIKKIKQCKKETSCWNKEFWIKKGFNENDAIEKVKEKQFQNQQRRNKESYSTMLNPYQKEYWIKKGYTQDESIEKIKQCKIKSNPYNVLSKDDKEKMLDNRKKTYYSKSVEERNKINKSRGITKDKLIEKYGLLIANEMTKNRGRRLKNVFLRYSKISKMFFDKIQDKLPDIDLYYGNDEKWIRKNKNKGYFIDMVIGETNKIIEFNGDFFHANPKLYHEKSLINISKDKKLYAKDIWIKDKEKIDFLSKEYDVYIVWENDVKNNIDEEINKCVSFIKK